MLQVYMFPLHIKRNASSAALRIFLAAVVSLLVVSGFSYMISYSIPNRYVLVQKPTMKPINICIMLYSLSS